MRKDVILDTDTYNEIDDQFALAYLAKSEDVARIVGITAAPFHNHKSNGPKDGMWKSYDEILKMLDLLGREDLKAVTFTGSEEYLKDEETPVMSDAAKFIAEKAMEYTPENPLYVATIGAMTNLASAILLKPEIADRIVWVFLGGNAVEWPHQYEFNLMQDVAACRVIMNSAAKAVQLPCQGVVTEFRTSGPELEYYLRGKNALCDYLTDIVERDGAAESPYSTWSRVVWDVTAIAWLVSDEFTKEKQIHKWIPTYDHYLAFDERRPMMTYVYQINRDALFEDLFKKLAK